MPKQIKKSLLAHAQGRDTTVVAKPLQEWRSEKFFADLPSAMKWIVKHDKKIYGWDEFTLEQNLNDRYGPKKWVLHFSAEVKS